MLPLQANRLLSCNNTIRPQQGIASIHPSSAALRLHGTTSPLSGSSLADILDHAIRLLDDDLAHGQLLGGNRQTSANHSSYSRRDHSPPQ
jgi:hypothetical protein